MSELWASLTPLEQEQILSAATNPAPSPPPPPEPAAGDVARRVAAQCGHVAAFQRTTGETCEAVACVACIDAALRAREPAAGDVEARAHPCAFCGVMQSIPEGRHESARDCIIAMRGKLHGIEQERAAAALRAARTDG